MTIESDCRLTHCDDICVDATVVYGFAIRELVNEKSPEVTFIIIGFPIRC